MRIIVKAENDNTENHTAINNGNSTGKEAAHSIPYGWPGKAEGAARRWSSCRCSLCMSALSFEFSGWVQDHQQNSIKRTDRARESRMTTSPGRARAREKACTSMFPFSLCHYPDIMPAYNSSFRFIFHCPSISPIQPYHSLHRASHDN